MTLANASIRARGNQDLRKSKANNMVGGPPQPPTIPNVPGFGRRSLWPLPPVGEAARRDPHIGDPIPNPPHEGSTLTNASPNVQRVKGFGAGGGSGFNGFPPALAYIKRIGTSVTRTLGRQQMTTLVDAAWRLGGVSMPFDQWGMGYGLGFQGDAQSLWLDNPQAYLRNPGIKPLTSVPATYRYVTLIGSAPVGPSIGDFGHAPTPGTP